MSETVNRLEAWKGASLVGEAPSETQLELTPELIASARPFVGEWQTLESTTNWEKGRIIAAWREQLEKAGSHSTEFSDQAWAQLVGGVTSQHVGRLRRTHQRYGSVCREYEGLYWSHFYAALEWPDAEMWLEGAVQNRWSVSKMRAKRWETVGHTDGDAPSDADDDPSFAEPTDLAADPGAPWGEGEARQSDPNAPSQSRERGEPGEKSDEESDEEHDGESDAAPSDPDEQPAPPRAPRERPFADLPELPADVADAFEQFKLVLLNHKLSGWQEIGRDDFVTVLESLKRLALAVDEPSA